MERLLFIGRERELHSLESVYRKNGFGMTVLFGRRRIGKSTLINEFVKGKKTIYYTATKVGAKRNLELFTKQVLDVLAPSISAATFPSVENVFDLITDRVDADGRKTVLVIDELPYWAEKDEALLSILQKYIDTQWIHKNMMVILCGSVLSFMEKKVLSQKSPVFGRRDSQIKLEAFDYLKSAEFVPGYTPEEKAIVYGVTGGVPKYLAMFDPEKSLDENIVSLFFEPDGYLYDEPRNMLIQEFTDVTLVNNVIEQVASGEGALSVIADKLHERPETVLYSLEKLIGAGLVERRKCMTEEKNKKKVRFVLKDQMLAFWYRFIPKAISVIEIGKGSVYYEKAVKPQLHAFMGHVFEDMCRRYTLEQGVLGAFGPIVTQVGTWWGEEPITDSYGKKSSQTADIDVVGLSPVDRTAVCGECKFRNEKIDKETLDTLTRRAGLLSGRYPVSKFLLFSLGGFTKWFETADRPDVVLISVEDLYRV